MPAIDRLAAELPATIKISSYSLLPEDIGTEIQFFSASAVSANLPAVGAVENGYNVVLRNIGAGQLTIDPDGSETVDGVSTVSLDTGEWRWIRSDGDGWKSVALSTGGLPAGSVGTTELADGAVTVAKLADAAKPYDMSFVAGFDAETVIKEDIAVQTYGELVIARPLTIEGEVGYMDTPATGSAAIVDVEKNGTSIYSANPQFAASSSSLTSGTLSTTSLASGDRLTFKVTQVGSTEPGEGLRFTLKCRLA